MGAKRWKPADKARGLGAMWASANELAGEWVPNFSAAAESVGVPRVTLMRWWDGRDRTQDERYRATAMRVRAAEAANGARRWFVGMNDLLRERTGELLQYDRLATTEPDQAARAVKYLADVVRSQGEQFGLIDRPDADDGADDSVVVDIRVRGALERVVRGGRPGGRSGGALPD